MSIADGMSPIEPELILLEVSSEHQKSNIERLQELLRDLNLVKDKIKHIKG